MKPIRSLPPGTKRPAPLEVVETAAPQAAQPPLRQRLVDWIHDMAERMYGDSMTRCTHVDMHPAAFNRVLKDLSTSMGVGGGEPNFATVRLQMSMGEVELRVDTTYDVTKFVFYNSAGGSDILQLRDWSEW